MSTVLETIYEPRESIVYTNSVMDANEDYPVSVGPTVLPEIWAPRLYAEGLSMLEIGSSGKVAFTAADKHALDINVRSVGEVGSEYDETSLVLPSAAMSLGTSGISVLTVSPVAGAPNTADLTLNAENILTKAAAAYTTTAGTMTTTVTGAASMSASEIAQTSTTGAISMSAFTDIVLSAGGNPTVTIKNDRILIKGDIDIDGIVNSTAVQSLQTLQVKDNYIEVADGLDYEVTSGIGSQNGLRINTVPNGGTMADGDAVDTYLKLFKSADGGLAFYTGSVFDQAKYDAANAVLNKGILFNVNGGSSVGGSKTQASRDTESYWDVVGGAMKITRVVPSATNDLVHRLSMALRVTNTGELEIVRHKVPLTLTNGAYIEGTAEPSKVVARFGHMVAVA